MSKQKKTLLNTEASPTVEPASHLVLYTDGGMTPLQRGDIGHAGWGVHGYLFQDVLPKQGAGNSKAVLSQFGYVHKSSESEDEDDDDNKKAKKREEEENARKRPDPPEGWKQVTPLLYFDAAGGFSFHTTNNVAELKATIEGLTIASERIVESVYILTDSRYVETGMNKYVANWKRNNWTLSTGMPVKNLDLWKKLVELHDNLKARGVKISYTWIPGHCGDVGNDRADKLATLGTAMSIKYMTRDKSQALVFKETSEAKGFWKREVDVHPFFSLPSCYFNTGKNRVVEGEYVCGRHTKRDDMAGTRFSNGALSIIRLNTPEAMIESVRNFGIDVADGAEKLLLLKLDKFLRPEYFNDYETHKELVLKRFSPRTLTHEDLAHEIILYDYNGSGISNRVLEVADSLTTRLDELVKGVGQYQRTDITSVLYDVIDATKNKPATLKLKAEYNVGFAGLKVDAVYEVGTSKGEQSVILTLGIDLLDRNALKRIEGRSPKVEVITWAVSEHAFQVATLITTNDAVGIWAGIYTNTYFPLIRKDAS